ncbi:MAG: DUF4382 domain-containing protein [archaeon]|jgi:plastocyanin
MNKKNIGVALLLIATALFLFGCTAQSSTGNGDGNFVVTLTDAAANMGSVSQINVTVDSVRVHSETQGWITLSSNQQTYDLLQLKAEGSQVVIAQTSVDSGNYNQIELNISNVMVVDDKGTHSAKLPSGSIRINTSASVDANATTAAKFDIIADESLHTTGNGEYILAPVVKFETRTNANIQINSENKATISGGVVRGQVKVGMDENGNVGIGIGIPTNVDIDISGNGQVIIGGLGIGISGNSNSNTNNNSEVNSSSETNVSSNVDGTVSVGVQTNLNVEVSADVSIADFTYSNAELVVHQGDTVRWTNYDSIPHTVTSVEGSKLDSGIMVQGETYVHTFDTKGTFDYYCTVHPNMTATVIVE